ncbi:MAG TPA: curli-like amyloid fiber formation chaperone CsgH [Micropepsaceae bacterium]|nr:curli-like amyloid fiber formation chaperone CsgH [Micropepsaceae bacterium]
MKKPILILSFFALGCASPVAGALADGAAATAPSTVAVSAPAIVAESETPSLACAIHAEKAGALVSLKALALAPAEQNVFYRLEIVKDGPDGLARNRQSGDIALLEGENILGETAMNLSRRDTLTVSLSLEDADGKTLCSASYPEET